jgi:AraC family transcriptional regulator, positive regulator of tynA and feaB
VEPFDLHAVNQPPNKTGQPEKILGRFAMSADDAGIRASAPVKGNFKVWDTQYVPPSKAFSFYREAIGKVYMHWSPEFASEGEFHARIEAAEVRQGSISRHRCTSHSAARTPADIANSPRHACYLALILSGEGEWRQRGRTTFAVPGDILVLDSAWPARMEMGPAPFDALIMTIPRTELTSVREGESSLANVLLKQNRTPLGKCLNLVADRMISASKEELTSLYDACVSLLPVEAGCYDDDKGEENSSAKVHYLLRGILSHIDQNIANAELSPNRVADQFGISVRYVHKLFIGCGVTFCSYTTARRLDYICKDLVSPACRQQPISLVAFRWGFNDLSSFNRAFKSRYGCTPSQFRMRSGT